MKLSFNTLLFVCGALLTFSFAAPVPSDSEVESRQLSVTAIGVVGIGLGIAALIKGIKSNTTTREAFTQSVVNNLHDQSSDFNYVIVHVKHTIDFAGEKDVDWGHSHQELDIPVGGTIGYEIYWFKAGTFTREGDGGFINWAFNGKVLSNDGRTLTFSA